MKTHVHPCKVFGATVDWLTCSAASKESRNALWNEGERVLHVGESEGERATRWHAHGYSGWQGPHVAFGVRKDGVCLRLSSYKASDQWKQALSAAENVSRLDLAVDCESDPPVPALSRQLYRDVRHTPSLNGRPPSRSLVVNGKGGSTVYVGARSSEQFGRVYDKGVESKTLTAGRWWRWELELKGDAAWNMSSQLKRIDEPGVMICATVASWFRQRTSHTYTSSVLSGTLVGSPRLTTIDKQLSWLAQGVRPTVQFLVDRVGIDRVLFALGLPPQCAVNRAEHPASSEEVA